MKPIAQQVILVTGSTDGLGKQTSLALAREGASVLLHGRDRQRLEMTRQEIQEATGNTRLETYLADFATLADVRHLAETLPLFISTTILKMLSLTALHMARATNVPHLLGARIISSIKHLPAGKSFS